MSVSAIGGQAGISIQQLVSMRAQLDELQRQLSTGKKADSYAGLGLDRGVTISLNSQLSAIGGYNDTINTVLTRVGLRRRRQRRRDGAADRAVLARRIARPAQHAGRRPLPLLRPRHRPAGGR